MADMEKCSKCSNELDTEGSPKWCKACRAKYQRDYNATKEGRAEARGFARGATTMKTLLAEEFQQQGSGAFSGYEVAAYAFKRETPRFEAQPED